MIGTRHTSCLWLVMAVIGVASAQADLLRDAGPRAYDRDFMNGSGYVETGAVRWYPSLQGGFGYDTNIFESAHNTEATSFSRWIPELSGLWRRGENSVQFGYQADSIEYTDSSADNFTDQSLFSRSHFEAGYRHRITLDLDATRAHEARGSGLTVGVDPTSPAMPTTPDVFSDERAALNYSYGAIGAAGEFRLALRGLDHAFDNHRDRTRFFDRQENEVGATFLWKALPNTALLLEARNKSIRYANDVVGQPSLDSQERDLLTGAEWSPSPRTSARLRVGRKEKDFESSARKDDANLSWELSSTWSPRTYTHLQLRFDRSPQETTGAGDFIDARTSTLNWKQQWRERFDTRIQVGMLDERYQNGSRDDRTRLAQFDAGYAMNRWLTWRVTAMWRDRSSDLTAFEFSRNRYWLTAEVRL